MACHLNRAHRFLDTCQVIGLESEGDLRIHFQRSYTVFQHSRMTGHIFMIDFYDFLTSLFTIQQQLFLLVRPYRDFKA